jgi:hypothetical protein
LQATQGARDAESACHANAFVAPALMLTLAWLPLASQAAGTAGLWQAGQ